MTKRPLEREDRRDEPKRRRNFPVQRMYADNLPSPPKLSQVEREG